jgi:hypothetical protein
MRKTVFAALGALAFAGAAPAQASTFVSVFNFSWSGSVGAAGIWGITASSEFIDPFPDDDPRFDQVNVAYSVSGRVDIVGTLGSTFTREDVISLNLDVMTNGYRIASYSIAKDDLRIGVMSGTIVETPLGDRTAELSAFRLMQRQDPTDPLQKFEQIFGCPTIQDTCGAASFVTPVPAYDSGNPIPPNGLSASYGVVVLTDGRSDPCCGARSNALRFYYETVGDALASYRLNWNRDLSYPLPDPIPEGLPAPVPLPAALPMLIGAIGALGIVSRRAGRRQRG